MTYNKTVLESHFGVGEFTTHSYMYIFIYIYIYIHIYIYIYQSRVRMSARLWGIRLKDLWLRVVS